jgi:hypothetical protein
VGVPPPQRPPRRVIPAPGWPPHTGQSPVA